MASDGLDPTYEVCSKMCESLKQLILPAEMTTQEGWSTLISQGLLTRAHQPKSGIALLTRLLNLMVKEEDPEILAKEQLNFLNAMVKFSIKSDRVFALKIGDTDNEASAKFKCATPFCRNEPVFESDCDDKTKFCMPCGTGKGDLHCHNQECAWHNGVLKRFCLFGTVADEAVEPLSSKARQAIERFLLLTAENSSEEERLAVEIESKKLLDSLMIGEGDDAGGPDSEATLAEFSGFHLLSKIINTYIQSESDLLIGYTEEIEFLQDILYLVKMLNEAFAPVEPKKKCGFKNCPLVATHKIKCSHMNNWAETCQGCLANAYLCCSTPPCKDPMSQEVVKLVDADLE